MASHVSQCMAKACMCDTWQAMCVTHGMPCVNMHGSLPCLYKGLTWAVGRVGESSRSVHGSSKEKRKGGKEKEEERKRESEERKGGREARKGERKEEKRRRKGRKRVKRKRKRKECCVVSSPGRQSTQNCPTRGRFPPTLVILHLGAV